MANNENHAISNAKACSSDAALIAAAPELIEILECIVLNAVCIPDPRMDGTTDTYSVPMDDIDTARKILAAIATKETKL